MNLFKRLLHDFGVKPFAPLNRGSIKLSEAMLKGDRMYQIDDMDYNHCALGVAYRYKTGKKLGSRTHDTPRGTAQREFPNVPSDIIARVDALHCCGMKRDEIAHWLQELGY